jgi:type II secretion system protein H
MLTAPRSKSFAFTLLELMVVIAIIGIVTAVMLPEMRGTYEDAVLRATGRQLVEACNFASSQAVTLNRPHRVHFDPKHTQYKIEAKAETVESGFVPLQNTSAAKGSLDSRISIEIQQPAQETNEIPAAGENAQSARTDDFITFYADGTADPIQIILRDRQGFALGLQMNPTTARVRIIELERQ